MTDQGIKTPEADYFVFNDSSNGHFYVVPMSAFITSNEVLNGVIIK